MTEYHDQVRKVAAKLKEIEGDLKSPNYLHTDLYNYTDGTLNLRIDARMDHDDILRLTKVLCYLRKVMIDQPPTTSITRL
ncbi:hypothetical protein Thiosp_01827 [Thiorhodovibrio litoralis]|jgi:hypothetical protein|nr:hypothetical protein [Thiorhodovibrio winogradskyi]WPL12071.1 hypothetical protein Thiosp_01827 [Thiorhodovibrio litoralis]